MSGIKRISIDEIKKQRELCEKATPGPWVSNEPYSPMVTAENPYGHGLMHIADVRGWGHLTGQNGCSLSEYNACKVQMANSNLIVSARNSYLTVLDALEVAYAENDRLTAKLASDIAPVDENTSDGYHTFKELYHHRAVLFAALIAQMPEKAWKSKTHSDGSVWDGWFIVGIETPEGQATYHYAIDPYWDMYCCREVGRAPEWDGHTPAQAIERIGLFTCRPANLPLTREQVEAMDGNEAVWLANKVSGYLYSPMSAKDVQELLECKSQNYCEFTLYFAAVPTPADIEAARIHSDC